MYVYMYVCVLFFNDKCGQLIMITNDGTGSREVDLQVFLSPGCFQQLVAQAHPKHLAKQAGVSMVDSSILLRV